jgi:hypothetical protein
MMNAFFLLCLRLCCGHLELQMQITPDVSGKPHITKRNPSKRLIELKTSTASRLFGLSTIVCGFVATAVILHGSILHTRPSMASDIVLCSQFHKPLTPMKEDSRTCEFGSIQVSKTSRGVYFTAPDKPSQ